ncbi:RDD family protein [Microbacterium marinilacus]|uniref:RDD family protein n=1 Tax=Microbacterium marinilacus TaxID=415209 RepID=A0ABP7BBL3_9MICO|nr:RDD family protein [Microbacterium marinilacus]MBY0687220.1 RDD family protein [Microbacterium marinilacus]
MSSGAVSGHPPAASARGAAVVADDEVLTGEAVALDVQPIGLILRVAGAAIDVVLTLVVYVTLVLLMVRLLASGALDQNVMQILSIVLAVLLLIVVPTVVETVSRGRSLGKLAVGGRIVRLDGGAISFRHAFIRAVTGVLEVYLTLGALALLVGVFSPRSQRLGDLVAGTYAERTRTPRLVPGGVVLPPGMEAWAAIADVGRLPVALARRIAQFVAGAGAMHPAARARVAEELAAQTRPHVAPVPPVDAETMLRAVVAVRRGRELHALTSRAERVARLSR